MKHFLNYFAVHFVSAWAVFFYLCFTALLAGIGCLMGASSIVGTMITLQVLLFLPFFLLYGREAGLSSEFIRAKENPILYVVAYGCVHFFNFIGMINLLKTHFVLSKIGYQSLMAGQIYLASEPIREAFGDYAGFVEELLAMFMELTTDNLFYLDALPLRVFYYGLVLFAMTMLLEFGREYWLSRNPTEEETFQVDWAAEEPEKEDSKENKIDLK